MFHSLQRCMRLSNQYIMHLPSRVTRFLLKRQFFTIIPDITPLFSENVTM